MCNFFCNLTLHLDMQYAYITIVTNFWKYDQCPSTIINLESHHHHFFVINNLIFHTVHGCCENFKNVCSFELKIVLTVVLKNQNSFLFSKNQIMRMDGGGIWCWSWSHPPVTLKVKFMQVYSSTKSYLYCMKKDNFSQFTLHFIHSPKIYRSTLQK